MKHKLLTALLALVSALCLILGISACGGGTTPPGHTHTFASTWSSDESGHWHAATCEHTSEHKDEARHTYENGKCTICNYEHKAHTIVYSDKTEKEHTGTCSVCGKAITENHSYENGVCTECNYAHKEHTYQNGVCTECNYAHKEHTYQNGVCTECNYAHQDHNYGADNICSVCGAKKPYSKENGMIYLGEYPQTEVTDENDSDQSLRNSLNMAAGSNPTADNAGKWTSYGYYSWGEVTDNMWYIDVEYQENRYRGVYFTSYRPYWSNWTSKSYQGDNGYKTNRVYWFKYESIEWRILEEKDGTALLMANIILDSQAYYHKNSGTRTIDGKTVYSNNYKESDIRAWLNETFYNTAFDEYAKRIVETTTVDNSTSTKASSSNEYVCEDTEDKVFLLSYKDVLNTSYGFSSSSSTYDKVRQLKSTDYAKSQGILVCSEDGYVGNSLWWLRSPDDFDHDYVDNVSDNGCADYYSSADITCGGVVPAIWIRL